MRLPGVRATQINGNPEVPIIFSNADRLPIGCYFLDFSLAFLRI